MKRFILAIAAIPIVVMMWSAPQVQAVMINGERQVVAGQATVSAVQTNQGAKLLGEIKKNSARISTLKKSTDALVSEQRKMVVAQTNTAEAVKTMAGNIGTLAEATENVAKKADLADKNAKVANQNVVAYGKAILENGSMNTWILAIISILGFGIIAALIICFGSRNENSMTTKTVKVLQAIEKVPEKTVDEIKAREFDPAPFEFDVAGKHVVYTFPVDDKCYRTLKVEDTNGSSNPADFDQQTLINWYQAKKYVTGTMKKFLEGKLAGTKEEELINYLVTTKKIKISKK